MTDYLKGKKSEVCYKNSEVTDITVTAANIVYGVEHDAAGNVRSTTKAAKNHQRAVSNRNVAFKTLFSGLALNITTAIFNNWIDGCSDVQEKSILTRLRTMWTKRTVQIKPTERQMSPLWVS